MSIDFSQKAKAKQLNDFFQSAGRIYIVVDASADAVNVPDFLKGDPALRLALNVRMRQPIYIRDDGVSSVFSFSGQPHDCFIPLQYIWAAYEPDGDLESGLVWESDVPEIVRSAFLAQTGATPIAEGIEGEDSIESIDLDDEAKQMEHHEVKSAEHDAQTRPSKVPHLRIVK